MLPFTAQQFFAVFARYNETVWPMQWVLTAVAIAIVLMSVLRIPWRSRAVCLLLAGLWVWMAIAYHALQFSRINAAAFAFAGLFLLEAGLLVRYAMTTRSLDLRYRGDATTALGVAMLVYALVAYPLLGRWLGHVYPAIPTFGAPCPTTIFTCGILTLSRERSVLALAVLPLLWSLIGGSAAFALAVWQDLGLIASGLVMAGILLARHRRARV